MRTIIAILLLTAVSPLYAELPEFYKSVDRLVWVVEDIDKTLDGMRSIGFTNIAEPIETDLNSSRYGGKQATGMMKFASGRFGDLAVHFVQPVGGENAFTDFAARHGSGVFSLMHRVNTAAEFDAEVVRMKQLGVDVLEDGNVDAIRYALFDTEPEGKYVLGIIHFPGGDEGPLTVPPDNPSGRKVSQFAFAVRDLERPSRFWAKLGFPAFDVTHGKLRDLKYRGKPGKFDMKLGWQRHGKVVYEWILSIQGPDVYEEHMVRHGEGFHHLAFGVKDMDADLAWWAERGYPESMSGAWGEKDKPGSGRFAYVDTQSIGGIDVELLWNYQK